MKAITLWQPWATLIVLGLKQYETRSWSTSYRGDLVIHAASRVPRPEEISTWIAGTLGRFNYLPLSRLPLGVGLCVVRLVDVVPTKTVLELAKTDKRIAVDEIEFGDYSSGRFAWKLADVRPFPEPIKARGYQLLWDWKEGN